MMFGFLFWLFLIGIVVASLQDLKRREVDNWLNVFLLVASFVFVFYVAIFNRDVTIIFRAGFGYTINPCLDISITPEGGVAEFVT